MKMKTCFGFLKWPVSENSWGKQIGQDQEHQELITFKVRHHHTNNTEMLLLLNSATSRGWTNKGSSLNGMVEGNRPRGRPAKRWWMLWNMQMSTHSSWLNLNLPEDTIADPIKRSLEWNYAEEDITQSGWRGCHKVKWSDFKIWLCCPHVG